MIIAQAAALCIAFVLDLAFGNSALFRCPSRIFGTLAGAFAKALRKVFPKNRAGELVAGTILTVLTVILCGGIPLALLFFAYRYHILLGAALETIICCPLISAKATYKTGGKVYSALMCDDILGAAKNASSFAKYDASASDDVGITSGTVTAIAEDASDKAISPLIFMAIGGAVFGCVQRSVGALNTILWRGREDFGNFGKAAAGLDFVLNYLPECAAAYTMIVMSFFLGFDFENAVKIHRRDGRAFTRTNGAQTVSVVAGALGIRISGGGRPAVGDTVKDIKYINIKQTNKIMYASVLTVFVLLAAIKFAVGAVV